MQKITHEEFIEKLKKVNLDIYNQIEIIGKYKNESNKILIKNNYGLLKISPCNLYKIKNINIKSAINKHSYFLNELKGKNLTMYNKIKVLGVYIGANTKILIKDKYGYLNVRPINLYSDKNTSVRSAVDKSKYFEEMAKEVHANKYKYDKTEYKKTHENVIIICPTHGEFSQQPSAHLQGEGCPRCKDDFLRKTRVKHEGDFIKQAKEKHSDFYNYDKVNYVKTISKVIITCPIHGDFKQTPSSHLSGRGCPHCSAGARSITLANRHKEDWIQIPSQLYIIKCHDINEEFYKIGISRYEIKQRFAGKKMMPYEINIIKEIKLNQYIATIIEASLHNSKLNKYSYVPNKKFNGYTECYSKLDFDLIDKIIKKEVSFCTR